MGTYTLECAGCKHTIPDNYTLRCECGAGLIRARYAARQLSLSDMPGMWRYYDWLPTRGRLDTPGAPVTYKSEGLSKELGLKELYISFNGYWPEMGARMDTCSFKELEAPPTIVRAREHGGRGNGPCLSREHGQGVRVPLNADRLPRGHRGAPEERP